MKKWLSMLLMVSLVLMLGASCGTNSYYKDEDEEYSDEEYVEEDFEKSSADSGIEGLRSEVLPQDKMFYLIRDGETYSLGNFVNEVDGADYSCVGVDLFNKGASTHRRIIYGDRLRTNDGGSGRYAIGDVPVAVLQDGDVIASYSDSSVPTLGLYSVSLYGYALDITYSDEYKTITVYDGENDDFYWGEGISNFEVTDADGNTVEDYFNLVQDGHYIVSWFVGTQYEEHELRAISKFYSDHEPKDTPLRKMSIDYTIEGDLTKDGYASYDLSGIPAGTYLVMDAEGTAAGGIIEIQ